MELKSPEVHARIERLINEDKERPFAWAQKVGISKGAFTRIWNEGTVPSHELLVRIQDSTGVSIDWLLTGKEPMYRKEVINEERAPGALDDEFALVPLYDVEVSAGPGREVLSEEPSKMLAFRRDWLREMGIQNGQAVVVTARGDSMEPTIAEGDTLLVDRGQKGGGRDGIYIMSQGGVLRVKRLQWLTNGDVRVMSDCSAYQDETVSSSDVARLQIVGRVVWGGRRF